jgi:hypothetical protein
MNVLSAIVAFMFAVALCHHQPVKHDRAKSLDDQGGIVHRATS